jgi:hypothetical protein
MTTFAVICLSVILVGCVGVTAYLFARGRIPDSDNRTAGPWILLIGRLTLLTAATFAVLVKNLPTVLFLAFAAFLASVMIEVSRRHRAAAAAKQM